MGGKLLARNSILKMSLARICICIVHPLYRPPLNFMYKKERIRACELCTIYLHIEFKRSTNRYFAQSVWSHPFVVTYSYTNHSCCLHDSLQALVLLYNCKRSPTIASFGPLMIFISFSFFPFLEFKLLQMPFVYFFIRFSRAQNLPIPSVFVSLEAMCQ